MKKSKAISTIIRCAKQYENLLNGYQVAFVYRDEHNHTNYTEVKFRDNNFLHFTGVSPSKGITATDFYRNAVDGRLKEDDFIFKNDYTTNAKLWVLDAIMFIDTKARMIGNYIGPRIDLYTEKVTGTTSACLGLIEQGECYIPNSVLSEDIRNVIPKPPGKIFAIFKKPINSKVYTQLTYRSQTLDIIKKCLPTELMEKIDPSLLEEKV